MPYYYAGLKNLDSRCGLIPQNKLTKGEIMKVENLANNQVVVTIEDARIFFSYGTAIAKKTKNGNLYIDENYWDYSATTLKYLKQFLNTTKTKSELKAWFIVHAIMTDLNEED